MSGVTIKYVVDATDGKSLITTVSDQEHGWVEHCNQHGQLFYADAVGKGFYKKCHQQVLDFIAKYAIEDDKKNLGFINHLSNILINEEFIFPMFGVLPVGSKELEITAGLTRLIASIMNGRTADELNTIAFAPKGQEITQLENIKPLTSTADFEKVYKLADIDYEISMADCLISDPRQFRFDRSVLRHSIYDKKDQALPHTQVGFNISNFWSRHVKKDKIQLNIRCSPETEKLIQPSKIFCWNVVHENASEWQWSYGKILSAYRKTEIPMRDNESQLNLWLYDATEPVYLDLLFPWITGQYTCCYTKNKTALFFDTSQDITSMQIIGNWVK
jgi:hypothetical protein